MLGTARVQHLDIDRIDLDDDTFRFRAALRVGPLKASLARDGQQLPIVVRKRGQTRAMRYQLISGFRRTAAMRELGATTIAAIVRDDLDDDEEAFRASVLENSQRKTYSDIDRALAIKLYEDRGYTSIDVAALMGLSKRQKNNLKGLLDLPRTVRDAIDDPNNAFTATHGLVLKQLKGRYPGLHYPTWVTAVSTGIDGAPLSVSQLKRAVNAHYRTATPTASLGSIFRPEGTDAARRVYRLQPVKIDVDALSDDERSALRAELEGLLADLG
jgi:ParB/RepB/Spo0J family partition protein